LSEVCSERGVGFDAIVGEIEAEGLHTHIHLENNILFPRAMGMARKLGGDR